MLNVLTQVRLVLVLVALLAGVAFGQAGCFEVVREGAGEDVRAALQACADLEARDNAGATPLMLAAWWNENPDVVRALLDAGANPTATDRPGRRAIELARENEHLRGTDAFWRLHDASFN